MQSNENQTMQSNQNQTMQSNENNQILQNNNNNLQSSNDNINKTLNNISNAIPTEGFNFKKLFMWGGLFILLGFLGFNIFATLGKATDSIGDIFRPILSLLGLVTVDVASKSLNVASEGTKEVTNVASNVIDSGIDLINNTTQYGLSFIKDRITNNKNNSSNNKKSSNNTDINSSSSNTYKNTIGKTDTYNSKDIDKLSDFIDGNFNNINNFNSNTNKSCKSNCLIKCTNDANSSDCSKYCDKYCDEVMPNPDPVIDRSRIQSNKASSKSGFCYIGEENGIRSCVKVSEHDVCTSGKIYPTRAICQNPKLRQ